MAYIKPNLYRCLLNNPYSYLDEDGRDEVYWPPGNNAVASAVSSPERQPEGSSASPPRRCINFAKGVEVGLRVRSKFIKMTAQYECCINGKVYRLEQFDGCKDGSQANWTVAHRITGCELKAAGVDKETMDLLNAVHETVEFCRGEFLGFTDWPSYVDDTFKDMKAIQEGYNTDGRNCYTRFIPSECQKKTKD